jgi:hypothetical protein
MSVKFKKLIFSGIVKGPTKMSYNIAKEHIKESIDNNFMDLSNIANLILNYSWIPVMVQVTISTKPLDMNPIVDKGCIKYTHEFGIENFIRIAPSIYHILESGAVSLKVYEQDTNRSFFKSSWGCRDRTEVMDMISRINDWYHKNYNLDFKMN